MNDDMIERIYTIPLRDVKKLPRTKRAPVAMRYIRKFVSRHMKVNEKNVLIDTDVNNLVWNRGREHIPSKVKVKTLKFREDDIVEVTLPEISTDKDEVEEESLDEITDNIEENINKSINEEIEATSEE